jgi:hypothetical protein
LGVPYIHISYSTLFNEKETIALKIKSFIYFCSAYNPLNLLLLFLICRTIPTKVLCNRLDKNLIYALCYWNILVIIIIIIVIYFIAINKKVGESVRNVRANV